MRLSRDSQRPFLDPPRMLLTILTNTNVGSLRTETLFSDLHAHPQPVRTEWALDEGDLKGRGAKMNQTEDEKRCCIKACWKKHKQFLEL